MAGEQATGCWGGASPPQGLLARGHLLGWEGNLTTSSVPRKAWRGTGTASIDRLGAFSWAVRKVQKVTQLMEGVALNLRHTNARQHHWDKLGSPQVMAPLAAGRANLGLVIPVLLSAGAGPS